MQRTSRTFVMTLASFMLLSAAWAGAQDWPQWRGPNRDNMVTGFTEPKTWPKELTKKWKESVGEGLASPVLVGDKVFVFTKQGSDEVTVCLECMEYVSIIHAIVCSLVFMSGAGTSLSGPMKSISSAV